MKTTALIVAAGAGVRMGLGRPKAFADLAGLPLVEHSLVVFQDHPRVDAIVLMAPGSELSDASRIARRYPKVDVVAAGGERRQDTVRMGLEHIPGRGAAVAGDLVLVHDAARPLVDPTVISRVLDAAARTGAAVPGVAPADTVRHVEEMADPMGRTMAAGTLDRHRLVLVQTPQGFGLALLRDAYARAGQIDVTDDAALIEMMGGAVEVVAGSPRNLKITTIHDLEIAAALLARPEGD
ncbi:MAG TPA: 2-C-methyl-D-erythritol 4-phosphate cytidylyltransferase [Candidatus Polarisedimenticolia bacterium]|jgi:2-C-methyl-D-erythritol 4-phosphate cytidylyltransferase